jgi:hypothetical protein
VAGGGGRGRARIGRLRTARWPGSWPRRRRRAGPAPPPTGRAPA